MKTAGICRDPRKLGCTRPVQLKKHQLCCACYAWMRNRGRLKLRAYIPVRPRPEKQQPVSP